MKIPRIVLLSYLQIATGSATVRLTLRNHFANHGVRCDRLWNHACRHSRATVFYTLEVSGYNSIDGTRLFSTAVHYWRCIRRVSLIRAAHADWIISQYGDTGHFCASDSLVTLGTPAIVSWRILIIWILNYTALHATCKSNLVCTRVHLVFIHQVLFFISFSDALIVFYFSSLTS